MITKKIEIKVNAVTYTFKNSLYYTVDDFYDKLAKEIYARVRASTTDVTAIAENTGLKIQKVENYKRHVFLDEHTLNRYPECVKQRRFEASVIHK